ncbi:NAD(P)-binding domain-containing protein [Bacteroidota bacterium]|nr:NAD(P)-binding domain-containing protein [Bacteroidota bacterium]
MIVLANDGISQSSKKELINLNFKIFDKKIDQSELISYINNYQIEIILVRSATIINSEILNNCKSIKLIGRAGVGLDNIDLISAKKNNVKVFNTPNASSISVAELVISHLLSANRDLHITNRSMPLNGDTKFKEIKSHSSKRKEVMFKTLGIIGLGRIGQEVAKRAFSLGMNVVAFDKNIEKIKIQLDHIKNQNIFFDLITSSLDDVLKKSDFITLHIPKINDKPFIGRDEFDNMKTGVGIINTSRGGLIDEGELIKFLNNKKVSFAALDVYENEPTPNIQLLMHDKISLSPHIGGSTVEAQERIGDEIVKEIKSFYKFNG